MDDLISRQAALDIVFDFAEAPHNMYQKIRELPSADIEQKPSRDWNGWENGCGRTYDFEPKHGKWNDHTCTNWHGWHCSVCDYETQRRTRYCPNCGSRMERNEE